MGIGPPMPSFGANFRIIKAFVLSDCDNKLVLWANSALPVAGDIAMAYISFDIHSFVKRLIRVPGARQNRHSRKGNRSGRPGPRRRGPGGIPEIADMAADVIDPDGDMKPPRYRTPTQFLFVLDDVVERAGYTIMLFESVGQLAWEPFAALLQSDKRNCPDIPRVFSTSGSDALFAFWTGILMKANEVNVGFTAGLGGRTSCLVSPCTFTVAGKMLEIEGNPQRCGFRFAGTGQPEEIHEFEVEADSVADFMFTGEFAQGQPIGFEGICFTGNGNVLLYDITFFGFGLPE